MLSYLLSSMFNKKGVTLIELIIFLAVLLILASIIAPSVESVKKRSLMSAAQQLKSDIRYAQKLAIKDTSPYEVSFFKQENQYGIYATNADKPPIKRVFLPKDVTIKFINASNNVIGFASPIGTVSGACTITLACDHYAVDITVAVGSGRVKVYDIKKQ